MKHILLLFLIAYSFTACRKIDTGTNPIPTPQPDRGVFIINEGAFPGPGTVTFYNITRDSVVGTVVGTSANWITPNDGKVVNNRLYVAVTGSDKIEILNAETFQSEGSIQFPAGTTSPALLYVVDSVKTFVACYDRQTYDKGYVVEVNLVQKLVVRVSAQVIVFPGGISVVGNRVYVSDMGSFSIPNNKIKVLDAATLTILDSITVGVGPGMIVRGTGDTLYVVTSGKVYAINTTVNTVIDSTTVGESPTDIVLRGQALYVLHSDRVMKLRANPLSVEDTAFIMLSGGLYFYALGVSPINGDLYVSRVVNQGGNGEVLIYTTEGALRRPAFAVGLFPGAFVFK